MFKVIVAGGRDFNDYELLKKTCDHMLQNQDPSKVEIVSGGCRGSDLLGEQYAKEKGYPIKQFLPDWSLGKRGGYLRNKQMAEYSDALICFYDGKSKGTGHMIDLAKKQGLKIKVVTYPSH